MAVHPLRRRDTDGRRIRWTPLGGRTNSNYLDETLPTEGPKKDDRRDGD
jgi:hypothetical protein